MTEIIFMTQLEYALSLVVVYLVACAITCYTVNERWVRKERANEYSIPLIRFNHENKNGDVFVSRREGRGG